MKSLKLLIKRILNKLSDLISFINYPLGKLIIYIFFKKKKYKIIINHRNYGYGHQLYELPYADFILNLENKSGLVFKKSKPANSYLNSLIKNIKFVSSLFYFFFKKNVIEFMKSSTNYLDVGSSPDEIDIHSGKISKADFIKIKDLSHSRVSEMYNVFSNKEFKNFRSRYSIIVEDEKSTFFKDLKNIGIGRDEWFVCIHAREDYNWMLERSNSIENYYSVAEFINSVGGKVIRLGKNNKKISNDLFIDLSGSYINSDKNNILFLKYQKYMISCSSGPSALNGFFNIPQLVTNVTWDGFPPFENENFIIKIIKDENGNFLSGSSYDDFYINKNFSKKFDRYKIMENSGEDILNAFKNLYYNRQLNNSEIEIYDKWKKTFSKSHPVNAIRSKLDLSFLKKYKQQIFNK